MGNNQKCKIPLLSFFSGGGFLDMGFELSGFEIKWTNELDLVFSEFYSSGMTSWKKSFGKSEICKITNNNSIKDIKTYDIISQAFGESIPEIFGVIGGPPCQDFSINGNLDGFKGDKGSLTDAFLFKILDLAPSFFVMENVPGLMRIKKHRKHFLELLEILKDDFIIDFDILNSLDFGVAQNRERLFVIGLNKEKLNLNNLDIGINGKWFPLFCSKKESILKKYAWPHHNEFGIEPEFPKEIPFHLCIQSCLVPSEQEHIIPNANEFFNLQIGLEKLKSIKEGETNRPSFKRLHRYKFSPTACYGNNEVHLHPYKHRRLSVRETLRIQGVPDSYILPPKLNLSKKFKMIGNGVPVPLAKIVAETLRDYISDYKLIS